MQTPKGVRVVSDSSLEISFTYKNTRCRERIKLKPTKPNIKRVARHRDAILDAIERGTFNYAETFPNSNNAKKFAENQGEVILIKDYLDQWCKQKEQQLKSSTISNYWKIIDHRLIPQFGDKKLSELKRSDVRKWCATLDVSNKTISNLISPLRAALQDAFNDELITENPLANWTYRNRAAPKIDNLDPFTKQEQADIIQAIHEPENQNLITFLLWTGLRTSEVVALNWADINEQQQTVHINKAKTQLSDEPEAPKTQTSHRTIKLLPPALAAIKQQKAFTFGHESGCVFLDHKTGEPWTGDQPIRKKLWIPALERANVRYRYPYQTRHTFASMMISSGENISWLSKYLGHSNVMTTLKIYARWLADGDPNAGMKAVEKFTDKM
jgi:integrase